VQIKVLGTGCPKCKKLEEVAREAVNEFGLEAEVIKISDINRFMDYDVMMTPALVVNDKVRVMGRVPTKDEIKKWLGEAVQG
jgi:small redox-active disulfide protein 2